MKEMMRYGLILALICIVAGGLLATVNSITESKIIARARAEEESNLTGLLSGAVRFESVKSKDEIIYYKGYNVDNQFIGVVFKASGKGYSSVIDTMVAMAKDGTIKAIKVLSQNETPGLGSRVAEESFTGRFANKNTDGLRDIQAITGATISSKAVIDSVAKKAEEIKALLNTQQ